MVKKLSVLFILLIIFVALGLLVGTFQPASPAGGLTAASGRVIVTEPLPGQLISGELTIKGSANVFHNVLSYQVKDQDGNIIASGYRNVAAKADNTFGPFVMSVPLSFSVEQSGIIEVFTRSLEDGSQENLVSIPVRFAAELK